MPVRAIVDMAHARRSNRTHEGNAGKRQCREEERLHHGKGLRDDHDVTPGETVCRNSAQGTEREYRRTTDRRNGADHHEEMSLFHAAPEAAEPASEHVAGKRRGEP